MPPSPPTTTAANLRILRTFHGALILSIFLYAVVLKEILAPPLQAPDALLATLLGVLSIGMIVTGVAVRSRMIGRAYQTLRVKPDDLKSLNQWRVGAVLSAALAEGVVLCGVALYLIGKPVRQAVPFFVVGSMVMLLWWPQQP
jgi:hypothetical protein